MYRILLNFAKNLRLIMLIKINNIYIKKITGSCLNYMPLKLSLGVFFAGHTVAMVSYCVK